LLDRRPQALADPAAFTDADTRDLVTWFNLAWIDPTWLERDPELLALVRKGRGFTVADIRALHAKQREIASGVLPLYRRLAASGQLEVTASPYFHPILPLLYDTQRRGGPAPACPSLIRTYRAPADAAAQLALAVEAHREHFGAAPRGLWPSEGAVSPEILPLVRAAGFDWLATDEIVLARSLGRSLDRDAGNMLTDPRALYQPYRVLAGNELGPYVIFRDHELSDRIGFLYQHLPGQQAAEDMVYRLLEIRRRLNDPETPYLVSIILDGENCWEHYEHNGDTFLDAFYGELSRRPELKPVTVSEYLSGRRPAGTLARLATGSWIRGDLTTWIGDAEHNRAWEALGRTRAHLVARDREDSGQPSTAWQALYAAEGSDWFWWYSHRNSSQQDALFDRLFRHTLGAVYEAVGDEPPAWLAEPITRAVAVGDRRPAGGYVSARLSANEYAGEQWAEAASVRPESASTGTMQRAQGLIERLLVGHDPKSLSLRLELRSPLDDYNVNVYLEAGNGSVNQRTLERYVDPLASPADFAATHRIERSARQPAPFLYEAEGRDAWSAQGPVAASAGERVLECSVPLAALGLSLDDCLRVLVVLGRDGTVAAQLPERGMAQLPLTTW
jgi:alpha-amylase/alpha-mannosidase (GH57 family)